MHSYAVSFILYWNIFSVEWYRGGTIVPVAGLFGGISTPETMGRGLVSTFFPNLCRNRINDFGICLL